MVCVWYALFYGITASDIASKMMYGYSTQNVSISYFEALGLAWTKCTVPHHIGLDPIPSQLSEVYEGRFEVIRWGSTSLQET